MLETGKSMKAAELAESQNGSCRNIAITLIDPVVSGNFMQEITSASTLEAYDALSVVETPVPRECDDKNVNSGLIGRHSSATFDHLTYRLQP
jgi:hypothetical protein